MTVKSLHSTRNYTAYDLKQIAFHKNKMLRLTGKQVLLCFIMWIKNKNHCILLHINRYFRIVSHVFHNLPNVLSLKSFKESAITLISPFLLLLAPYELFCLKQKNKIEHFSESSVYISIMNYLSFGILTQKMCSFSRYFENWDKCVVKLCLTLKY